jgi:hypothetical protein
MNINGDHNNDINDFFIFLFFQFCDVLQDHP